MRLLLTGADGQLGRALAPLLRARGTVISTTLLGIDGTLALDKLILEEDELVELAQLLAIRLPKKSSAIIAAQLARPNGTGPYR